MREAPEAGMTLVEIVIAILILSTMMLLEWRTTSFTGRAVREYGEIEDRNHEVRVALARVVADLESAYISANEDVNASDRRTLMLGKTGGKVPELRFSSLVHRPLWADAHESEQTLIAYYALAEKHDSGKTDWVRRESRRLSNKPWKQEPADLDVLIRDVDKVTFEYWDWKDQEWRDQWDTTSSEGQKNRLPTRVRITVEYKNPRNETVKISTQARLLLQEQLIFLAN